MLAPQRFLYMLEIEIDTGGETETNHMEVRLNGTDEIGSF